MTEAGESRRWTIVSGPEEVEPFADHTRVRYVLRDDGEERDVFVELSGSAWHSVPDELPSPIDDAVRSRRRSEVECHLERHEPPSRLIVTTLDVTVVPRDGYYEPDDRIFVLYDGGWVVARVIELGEREDAVTVRHAGVVGGEYKRDVIFVRRIDADTVEPYRYEHVRPTPPDNPLA